MTKRKTNTPEDYRFPIKSVNVPTEPSTKATAEEYFTALLGVAWRVGLVLLVLFLIITYA
jgi:hypothetical protein